MEIQNWISYSQEGLVQVGEMGLMERNWRGQTALTPQSYLTLVLFIYMPKRILYTLITDNTSVLTKN